MRTATVNGEPGVIFLSNGKVIHVASFHIEDGVRAVYMTVNPDKLSRWSETQID
jgi:RNA polymerase sigma-70 factor (ECF subfamily)